MGEINESISNRLAEDTTEHILSAVKEGDKDKVQNLLVEDIGKVLIPEITKAQEGKTRAKRTVKPVTSGKVPDNVDGIVSKLEDQIKALRFLNSVQTADVPTPIGKDVREVLLAYQKDLQAIKGKYIEKIQKL